MSSLSESLDSGRVTTSNRMFKIFGVVFSLACISVIAYAGTDGSASGTGDRRLHQVCSQDKMQCGDGYVVMRIPELDCAFAPCPGGGGKADPVSPLAPVTDVPVPFAGSTTVNPQKIGIIVGSALGAGAAVGGVIAGAMVLSNQANEASNSRLYKKTDAIKPAASRGNVSQGVLVGVGALGFFACVFLAVTGAMYLYRKRRHGESKIVAASEQEEEEEELMLE